MQYGKTKKWNSPRLERRKLSSFAEDMIMCIENPINLPKSRIPLAAVFLAQCWRLCPEHLFLYSSRFLPISSSAYAWTPPCLFCRCCRMVPLGLPQCLLLAGPKGCDWRPPNLLPTFQLHKRRALLKLLLNSQNLQ